MSVEPDLFSRSFSRAPRRAVRRGRRRGFSLIEMIVTSLLVGVIVLGVVPLFTRAVTNNIYGADASQLASFLRSGTERVQQRSANDVAFEESSNVGTNPTGDPNVDPDDFLFTDANALRSIPTFYDTGARDSTTKADLKLGDERWVNQGTAPTGMFLWRQRRELREYSVADVFRGNISVGTASGAPATLSPLGNPKLFDSELPLTGLADIKEIRLIVESTKGGIGSESAATPSGIKQKATVVTYRAF